MTAWFPLAGSPTGAYIRAMITLRRIPPTGPTATDDFEVLRDHRHIVGRIRHDQDAPRRRHLGVVYKSVAADPAMGPRRRTELRRSQAPMARGLGAIL